MLLYTVYGSALRQFLFGSAGRTMFEPLWGLKLSKYSDIFNVTETQKLVQEVVSSVTEKTLTDWINTNMDRVVKKSVEEELAKIAQNKASAKK